MPEWTAFLQKFRQTPWALRGAVGGATLLLTAALWFGITRWMAPPFGLLFSDLDFSEGSKMISKLEAMHVPYTTAGGGSRILVPEPEVHRVRMALASVHSLPETVGYELFDTSDPLGSSSFLQEINRMRALEGELARTVRTVQDVTSVRVHLSVPKKELFAKNNEAQAPSAAVSLRMRGKTRLNSEQISAIRALLGASVPGLTPQRVTIVDQKGLLLANGHEDEGQSAASDPGNNRYERDLEQKLASLLARSLGSDRVEVRVSAEFEMDKKTVRSRTYDPETVARSVSVVSDTHHQGSGAALESTVGTANEVLPSSSGGGDSQAKSNKNHESTSYEISETNTVQEFRPGRLMRLAVAVLVDGTVDNGVYVPRSPQTLETLRKITSAAAGLVKERGDTLEIVNLPFASAQDLGGEESSWTTADLWPWVHLAETLLALGVAGALGLAALRRFKPAVEADPVVFETSVPLEKALETPAEQVEKAILENPETAASILHNWLQS